METNKLTESKYKFTYYLNNAAAERRPSEEGDIEDWIVEEREYPLDIEAFEYVFKNILNYDDEDLMDIYDELEDPEDDLQKIYALKNILDYQDFGSGEPIIVSIEGPGVTYDSGVTKADLLPEEDMDDFDDDLDESKDINLCEVDNITAKEPKAKRVAKFNEFDNGYVFHNWEEMSEQEAQEKAKQASIEDPDDVYYVSYDSVMYDGPDIYWYKGNSYTNQEVTDIRKKEKEGALNKIKFNSIEEALTDINDSDKYKQKFKDYCKDKIEDLGYVDVDEDGEIETFKVVMTAPQIRNFSDVKVIEDDNYPDNLVVVDTEGHIVINTPMIAVDTYAAGLEFDKIDSEFYNNLIEYWNELYMDEYMESDKVTEGKHIEFPTEKEKDEYIKDNNLKKNIDYKDKGIHAIELI